MFRRRHGKHAARHMNPDTRITVAQLQARHDNYPWTLDAISELRGGFTRDYQSWLGSVRDRPWVIYRDDGEGISTQTVIEDGPPPMLYEDRDGLLRVADEPATGMDAIQDWLDHNNVLDHITWQTPFAGGVGTAESGVLTVIPEPDSPTGSADTDAMLAVATTRPIPAIAPDHTNPHHVDYTQRLDADSYRSDAERAVVPRLAIPEPWDRSKQLDCTVQPVWPELPFSPDPHAIDHDRYRWGHDNQVTD